jgi:8-oxo-dGTP pyrophosphatase MutT (NUDIX family)
VEHLRLAIGPDRIVADGVMTVHAGTEGWAFRDERPFRVRYHLECDPAWRLKRLDADATGGASITLGADGAGHWTNARGESLPQLDGAIDVDIAACAFTNLPTIRRLQLAPGASATDRVVYVSVPALTAVAIEQRYTRLGETRFRYENLTNPYDTVIDVDADGATRHYPDVFQRLWPESPDVAGPLVASGIVERDGHVLLLRRGAADPHAPGQWEWVSGRVEPEESPATAVVREVKEQTGLAVEVVAPLATLPSSGIAFHCRAVSGTVALSAEHDASQWVPRDRGLAEADLTEGVRQGLARLLGLPR